MRGRIEDIAGAGMRYRFEGMEFDAATRQLSGPDGPIAVRAQSLAVLEYLLEHAPAVVSRDQVLDAVWGHQCTSDSSVAQTIRELRAALGDSSSEPRYIATRRRIGYQFVAAVERIDDAPATSSTPAGPTPSRPSRALPWLIAALAMVLLLVVWRWAALPEPGSPVPVDALALDDISFHTAEGQDTARSAALRSVFGRSLARVDGLRILDRRSAAVPADYVIDARAEERPDGTVDLALRLRDGDDDRQGDGVELSLSSAQADLSALGDALARAVLERVGLDVASQRLSNVPPIRLPSDPASQRSYFEAIEALDALDPERALALLVGLDEAARNEVPVRHLESRALAEQGDLLAARQLTRQLLTDTELWPRRERLAIEATAAIQARDYERAADRLQALNQFYPEPASVRRMIDAQIDAGRLDAARESLDRLEQLLPEDPRTDLLRARVHQADDDQPARLEAAMNARTRAEAAGLPRIAEAATRTAASALIAAGRLDEALSQLGTLESSAEWARRPSLRGPTRLLEARIRFERGELDTAIELAERAETDFTEVPDAAGIAEARIMQGSALEQAGREEDAIQRLEAALPLLEELGESASLARAHVNLGIARTSLGDYDAAQRHLGRAGAFYREAGDRRGEGAALLNQGSLLARSNRPAESESAFERAVEAFVDAGDLRGEAIALGNLASNASQRGETRRAIDLNTRALELFREVGADIDAARTAYNLGLVHRRLGDLARAESMVREAAERFLARDSVSFAARALTARGSMLVQRGRYEEAESVLRQLEELPIDSPMRRAEIETLHGELAEARGRTEAARERFQAALRLREDAPDWQRMSELDLARVALAEASFTRAEQEARRLAVSFREARDIYPQIDAMLLQAESLIRQSRTDDVDPLLLRIETLIDANRDARQNLQLALLRAQVVAPDRARQQLEWVRSTAAESGYEPLARQAARLLNALPEASVTD